VEITAAVGQVINPGTKIAAILDEDRSRPLICLAYFQVKDGKQLAPGMVARTALDSVQRERYGSLISRVQAITPFPISREAASNSIGNSELARTLIGDSRQAEVLLALQVNPLTPSGYSWTSSRGPEAQMTVGTTANVEVEIEARSPISFLLPVLREWVGRH
jgi:HlyD family secretion protein